MMARWTVVFALFVGLQVCNAEQKFRTEFTSSTCAELEPVLKPRTTIKISQLQGPWITLAKATYGMMDGQVERDFVMETTRIQLANSKPLTLVPDCIRHELTPTSARDFNLTTDFFFGNPQLDTAVRASYTVREGKQGYWKLEHTNEPLEQAVDFLILSEWNGDMLVYATCRGADLAADYPETDYGDTLGAPGLRTALHVLARPRPRGSHRVTDWHSDKRPAYLEVMQEVATSLKARYFLAARLSTNCTRPGDLKWEMMLTVQSTGSNMAAEGYWWATVLLIWMVGLESGR